MTMGAGTLSIREPIVRMHRTAAVAVRGTVNSLRMSLRQAKGGGNCVS